MPDLDKTSFLRIPSTLLFFLLLLFTSQTLSIVSSKEGIRLQKVMLLISDGAHTPTKRSNKKDAKVSKWIKEYGYSQLTTVGVM